MEPNFSSPVREKAGRKVAPLQTDDPENGSFSPPLSQSASSRLSKKLDFLSCEKVCRTTR